MDLTNVKHISFDVWNTLISPNLEYSEKRNQYLAQSTDNPVEFVSQQYTHMKHKLDWITQHLDIAMPTYAAWRTLLANMTGKCYNDKQIAQLYRHVIKLFSADLPIVHYSTIDMLQYLSRQGITLSIASNTNFTSGNELLSLVLNNWGVKFEFTLFSDLEGVGKPSDAFFNRVIQNVKSLHKGKITTEQILHVGDNYACDIEGPTKLNMRTVLCANPKDAVNKLGFI